MTLWFPLSGDKEELLISGHRVSVKQGLSSGELLQRGTRGQPHRMLLCDAQSLSRVRLFAIPWTVSTRLLCPWDFPDKNTGVSCHLLLQSVLPAQGLNLRLLHLLRWQADSVSKHHLGRPTILPLLPLSRFSRVRLCATP